jgi:dipeptidase E
MVLLLGGGGDAQQERPVLDRFVELAGATSIAYWPFALNLVNYANATSFTEAALGRPVQTWTSLDEHSTSDVQECGGVFIGGGNTYHLLSEVRRTGFDEVLRDFARTRVLYGGSAGAILFGSDIGTAGYFDSNDVGLVETKGLGLLGPYAVWCHYEDGPRPTSGTGHDRPNVRSSCSPNAPVPRWPGTTYRPSVTSPCCC